MKRIPTSYTSLPACHQLATKINKASSNFPSAYSAIADMISSQTTYILLTIYNIFRRVDYLFKYCEAQAKGPAKIG